MILFGWGIFGSARQKVDIPPTYLINLCDFGKTPKKQNKTQTKNKKKHQIEKRTGG